MQVIKKTCVLAGMSTSSSMLFYDELQSTDSINMDTPSASWKNVKKILDNKLFQRLSLPKKIEVKRALTREVDFSQSNIWSLVKSDPISDMMKLFDNKG